MGDMILTKLMKETRYVHDRLQTDGWAGNELMIQTTKEQWPVTRHCAHKKRTSFFSCLSRLDLNEHNFKVCVCTHTLYHTIPLLSYQIHYTLHRRLW
jgi:hypothetical protein